jgi:hypothetical protein
MVARFFSKGLIAATRAESTPALEELAACSHWPLVLGATPRRLQRELQLFDPDCLLFWLDDWLGIEATTRLIAWLRERGARPYRVAAAFQMDGDVETLCRAAGAHGFVSIAGPSSDAVIAALWPLVQSASWPVGAAAANGSPLVAANHPSDAAPIRGAPLHPP